MLAGYIFYFEATFHFGILSHSWRKTSEIYTYKMSLHGIA